MPFREAIDDNSGVGWVEPPPTKFYQASKESSAFLCPDCVQKYSETQPLKRRGKTGIWRVPPSSQAAGEDKDCFSGLRNAQLARAFNI
jgi:hypothetical protein